MLGSRSRALPSSCVPGHAARMASQNRDPAAAGRGARPSGGATRAPWTQEATAGASALMLSDDRGISAFPQSDLSKWAGATMEM